MSDELLQGTPTTIISCDKDVTLCSHCKKEIWKEEYISGVDSSTTKSNKDATCVTCAPESNDKSTTQQAGIENSKLLKLATTPVLKKQGVSGESCENSMQLSNNMPIAKYEKDFR